MRKKENKLVVALALSLLATVISFLIQKSYAVSGIVFVGVIALVYIYDFAQANLDKAAQIRKMEEIFPDFIDLMASNLRAGITIEKAMLLSSRKEFAPLDKEILRLGKEIITGKEVTEALKGMSDRINSDKIRKTVFLIITGIKSGGNLSSLLEETAVRLRQRNFVEKKAASNVLMYEIFIFAAIAVGAPALLALSSIMIGALTSILGNIPNISETMINMPFSLTSISISKAFVTYFSLVFLTIIDFMACLLLGLVNKGDEKAGLKYLMPLLLVSVSIFFAIRYSLDNYFSTLIG